MKKLIFPLITIALLTVSTAVLAESHDFEDSLDELTTVTNSLESGGESAFDDGFEGHGLVLDGSYGLKLGHVDGDFTASAMVKVTSGGDNRTLFFKNMGSMENENWTGVIFNGGVPTFWVRNGWSKRPTLAKNVMHEWVWVVYTEENGTGRLYVDGEQVSEGAAAGEAGTLYLGVTYWSADALSGNIDNVEILDRALAPAEIMTYYKEKVVPVRFEAYEFPSKFIVSDLDLAAVPGGADVVWRSDNESVLSSGGVLTRPIADTAVAITGTYMGRARRFEFTALGRGGGNGGGMILSYLPGEAEEGILTDLSGNGNHGVIHGDLAGGNFDGGDYVDLPKGLFEGVDDFTLVLRLTPWMNTTDNFTFCFGNSTDEYFALNTSTPGTNLLRAVITKNGTEGERDLITAPGIKSLRFTSIVITAEGTHYKMYVDGLLSAEDELEIKASDLGATVKSYIGKSVYDAPNFRGTIDEFTLYSYAIDEDEIYSRFSRAEAPYTADDVISDGYINWCEVTDGIMTLNLNRDCMVAVTAYDNDGESIYSAVRKVSGDNLTAELELPGVGFDIMAYDAATGVLKDEWYYAYDENGLSGFLREGNPELGIINRSETEKTVVIEITSYGENIVSGLDYRTVRVGAGENVVLHIPLNQNQSISIWEQNISLVR